MDQEQDKLFFKQFFIVILLLSVMMLIFLIVARLVGTDHQAQIQQREESVALLTAPMGQVNVVGDAGAMDGTGLATDGAEPVAAGGAGLATDGAEPVAAGGAGLAAGGTESVAADGAGLTATGGAAVALDGEAIYKKLCIFCHSVEGIGAPIVGNVEQWAPRIGQGKDVLYDRAINGYTGPKGYMPARGGGQLSDEEVMAAVDYMVGASQ